VGFALRVGPLVPWSFPPPVGSLGCAAACWVVAAAARGAFSGGAVYRPLRCFTNVPGNPGVVRPCRVLAPARPFGSVCALLARPRLRFVGASVRAIGFSFVAVPALAVCPVGALLGTCPGDPRSPFVVERRSPGAARRPSPCLGARSSLAALTLSGTQALANAPGRFSSCVGRPRRSARAGGSQGRCLARRHSLGAVARLRTSAAVSKRASSCGRRRLARPRMCSSAVQVFVPRLRLSSARRSVRFGLLPISIKRDSAAIAESLTG